MQITNYQHKQNNQCSLNNCINSVVELVQRQSVWHVAGEWPQCPPASSPPPSRPSRTQLQRWRQRCQGRRSQYSCLQHWEQTQRVCREIKDINNAYNIFLYTLVIGSSREALRVNERSLDVHQLVVDDSDDVYLLTDALFLPQLLHVRPEELHRLVELVCAA